MRTEKRNMLNKKPMLLVLAGPNGSGKSVVTQFYRIHCGQKKHY